jgi:hypothetical protein
MLWLQVRILPRTLALSLALLIPSRLAGTGIRVHDEL